VQDRIDDIRNEKVGRLRIVATPGLAHTIVPEALKRLLLVRPNVQVSLDIRRRENAIQKAKNNAADIGLAVTAAEQKDLELREIQMGEMVCIIPEGHPLEELAFIQPADLKAYPFIMMTRGSTLGNLITQAFDDVGEELKWSIETSYSASACTFVRNGFGVALVDEYVNRQGNIQGLVVKPFRPTIKLSAYLFYSKLKPLSNLSKLFIKSVTETLQH